MHRKLLDVLADPVTREPLRLLDDTGADWIEEGTLVGSGDRRYPIVRGIPRFVEGGYAQSFGLQWNRFDRVQLDSASGDRSSTDRFVQEVGWGPELGGQWVVDAGCGAGRFAEVAASFGAEVLAVDISDAVEAAARNLRHLPNVHVVQADIAALPFRPEKIRNVFSVGVLQHTPDPPGVARSIVEFLGAKGRFSFTIYGRRPWTRLNAKYLVRPLTRRLPPKTLLGAIEKVMPVLFPVTTVLFRLPLVGRVMRFCIPIANYTGYPGAQRTWLYQQAVLDTYDMLAPRFDRPMTPKELSGAIGDLCETLEVRSAIPLVVHGVRA